MWEPWRLATLGASTTCNRDIFTFYSNHFQKLLRSICTSLSQPWHIYIYIYIHIVGAVGQWSPQEKAEPQEDATSWRPRKGRNGDTPFGSSGRAALRREQCNGFHEGIARQQLCKQSNTHRRSLVWVTIDGILIGNWIYWTLTERNYKEL
jgi:hypothetical protein